MCPAERALLPIVTLERQMQTEAIMRKGKFQRRIRSLSTRCVPVAYNSAITVLIALDGWQTARTAGGRTRLGRRIRTSSALPSFESMYFSIDKKHAMIDLKMVLQAPCSYTLQDFMRMLSVVLHFLQALIKSVFFLNNLVVIKQAHTQVLFCDCFSPMYMVRLPVYSIECL